MVVQGRSAWLPRYRTSITVLRVTSRCRPKDQLCTYGIFRFGSITFTLSVTAPVRGNEGVAVNAGGLSRLVCRSNSGKVSPVEPVTRLPSVRFRDAVMVKPGLPERACRAEIPSRLNATE